MFNYLTLLIPVIAFWFTNITGVPQKIRAAIKRERIRPFDCAKCMAFWLSLIHQVFNWDGINSVVIICLSSLAGYLVEVSFTKLKIPFNL